MRSVHHLMRLVVLIMLAAAAMLLVTSGVRAAEPLRWKLQAGDKFDYVVVQDSDMTMSGGPGGQQMNMTMHQQMDMTWDVKNINADGTAVINQSINRARMTLNSPMGQGSQYDTKSEAPPTGDVAMMAPMYKAMTQDPVEITMTPRGDIVDVEIPEKMVEALKNVPGAAMMGDMTTAEGFKNMFMQGSMVLPEGPPAPGQKWTTSMEMNTPMTGKMKIDTTYEYQGTKDVDGTTYAAIEPTIATKLEGNAAVQMTVKDETSSGEVLFNQDQGRLSSSHIKHNMTMDIAIGGQTIQQTVDQTVDVKFAPVKE